MNNTDHRSRRDRDRHHPDDHSLALSSLPAPSTAPRSASGNGHIKDSPDDFNSMGYTLMVAGRRTGKTSFLRLLLDTSNVFSAVSKEQLASVAKFVHGCGGHTSHVRTVSVNIDHLDATGEQEDQPPSPLTLTLIDTPSLDFDDDSTSQRALLEILRHVDGRFAESIDDVSGPLPIAPSLPHSLVSITDRPWCQQERKAVRGDDHVHL